MTIRDLVENVVVQGRVEVKIIDGDYAKTVWEDDDFVGIDEDLERYADREIMYIYPGLSEIVIEAEKEEE